MKDEHTPVPWRVATPMTGDDLIIEACPGLEYHQIARVRAPQYPNGASYTERNANAAHIVEACNAYDSLVARNAKLVRALKTIHIEIAGCGPKCSREFLRIALDSVDGMAQAALKETP